MKSRSKTAIRYIENNPVKAKLVSRGGRMAVQQRTISG